jgi:type IV secretion system protein VirD4
VQTQDRSTELWHSLVRNRLIQQMVEQHTALDLNQENEIRKEIAERLFPLPTDLTPSSSGSPQAADITADEYDDLFQLQEDIL